MKKIIFIQLAILFLLSSQVFAAKSSLETKLDLDQSTKGITSLSILDATSTSGPVECYKATPGSLSKELSAKLCKGATSTAPVDCYKMTPGSLSAELSVKLCQGAKSTEPVECYKNTPGSLPAEQSVELCMANICDQ